MNKIDGKPICQVGDIIQYNFYPDDNIFLVYDIQSDTGGGNYEYGMYQYLCFSLISSEMYKFEFPCDKPEVLA